MTSTRGIDLIPQTEPLSTRALDQSIEASRPDCTRCPGAQKLEQLTAGGLVMQLPRAMSPRSSPRNVLDPAHWDQLLRIKHT